MVTSYEWLVTVGNPIGAAQFFADTIYGDVK
jgi:hypothetical protein